MDFSNFLHIWKREWMASVSKLFTYLFYVWRKYMSSWHWWAATVSMHVRRGLQQSLIDDNGQHACMPIWGKWTGIHEASVITLTLLCRFADGKCTIGTHVLSNHFIIFCRPRIITHLQSRRVVHLCCVICTSSCSMWKAETYRTKMWW